MALLACPANSAKDELRSGMKRHSKSERSSKPEFRIPFSCQMLRPSAFRFLSLLIWFVNSPGAPAGEASSATNGWKGEAPRDEIKPAFEFKSGGGPAGHDLLVIRADEREGLDGHWTKAFAI